jgi:acyl-CoA thioesterase I
MKPNFILKDIIEAFKNWLAEHQPQLIPIPVRRGTKPESNPHPSKFTGLSLLIAISALITIPATLPASVSTTPAPQQPKTILFLGDSITAGYGLDQSQAFPALIQQRIDQAKLSYTVINGGLSGETSSGGLRRIGWLLRSKVDIMVLELGANDGLRGIDLAVTRQNLQQIIDRTKASNPDVIIIIAGMQVPPNLGETYTRQFREMFAELANKNKAPLIPFILQGVAGEPSLNLSDGIHPNADGQKILANNVWNVLEPLIK